MAITRHNFTTLFQIDLYMETNGAKAEVWAIITQALPPVLRRLWKATDPDQMCSHGLRAVLSRCIHMALLLPT